MSNANANVTQLCKDDPADYAALRQRIAAVLNQDDLFEEFWADDLTRQLLESARYRRMLVGLLQASLQRALQRLLAPMVDLAEGVEELIVQSVEKLPSEKLAQGYFAREALAMERVDEVLQRAGLDWDAVQAEAMAMRSSEFQRLNQLLAKAEARRAATLRAIERHREGLGPQLAAVAEALAQADRGDDAAAPSAVKLAA